MEYTHDYSYEAINIQESVLKLCPKLNIINSNDEIYYRNLLLDKLTSLGFFGFLHTTEYNNFVNILKNQTLNSRNYNIQNGTIFIDDANKDVILHTESNIQGYVRFYYFPSTPTNYMAKYDNPVILVFNKRIIFDNSACFLSMGGANCSKELTQSAKEALTFKWDLISERGIYSNSKIYNGDDSRRFITAYRNAEFLIKKQISTQYISKVIFKYYNTYENACKLPHDGITFEIDTSLFH